MILWQLGFPIVSVLLFVYVFGSAMEVGGGTDYKTFAMPGMFAMTMAFGFMNTAYIMVVDKEKGVMDRFRSMPMARSAVVSGRGVGDLIGAAIDLGVLALIALAVGWRSDGSAVDTAYAFFLLLLLRFSLIWIGIYLAMFVPGPGAGRQPVRDRVPVRDALERVHAAVADARVAGVHRDVEPGVVDRERDPGAVRQPGADRGQLDRAARHGDGGGLAAADHGGVPAAGGAEVPAALALSHGGSRQPTVGGSTWIRTASSLRAERTRCSSPSAADSAGPWARGHPDHDPALAVVEVDRAEHLGRAGGADEQGQGVVDGARARR